MLSIAYPCEQEKRFSVPGIREGVSGVCTRASHEPRSKTLRPAVERMNLLANDHRFLHTFPQEVQIDVARLDGDVAGYAVLRIEPNGVAYLRNAMTMPAFCRRGVRLSLVAHRLAVTRTVGCTSAVLQAQVGTPASILI